MGDTVFGKLYGYVEEKPYGWVELDKALFVDEAPASVVQGCLRMVEEQFNMPLQNVWRVHVLANGLVELNDFTLPSNKDTMRETFRQEDLPIWIQDSLSVLMIVDQGVTIEGLGKKISDSIFYILETPDLEKIYGYKARSKGQECS
jgi:hypothetical protein